MFCKQCSTDKEPSDFLWNGKRGKWRVKICNECAKTNMSSYHATRMVGRKADEFKDAGD
jgi:protein-arginine kinase activator protein McsA